MIDRTEPDGTHPDADLLPVKVKRVLPDGMKQKQWESTAHHRERVLELIASGMTLAQAADHIGQKRYTVYQWRRRYPDWKARCDMIRGGNTTRQSPELVEITDESTFADKRYAYFGFKSYWHHHRIIDAIESAPAGGITLILVPPEHGKSSLVSDFISVNVGENPNLRIAYVSEGLGLSRKAIGKQQRRMEPAAAMRFPRFHNAYGPFHEEGRDTRPWTKDYFTVLKADHDEQDYCVDEETEALTEHGWRRHDEIEDGTLILVVNPDTGQTEWQRATIHRFETKWRDMVTMEGRWHSSLTTPDHRWWVRHGFGRRWTTSGDLKTTDAVPLAAPPSVGPERTVHTDAFVMLVAWAYTEGWWERNNLVIGQSESANPLHVEKLRRCLLQVAGSSGPMRSTKARWSEASPTANGIVRFRLKKELSALVAAQMPGKVPSASFLRSLTRSQIELFIDTSIEADGYVAADGGRSFEQKRIDVVRAFEMACVMAGYPIHTTYNTVTSQWRTTILRSDWHSPVRAARKNKGARYGVISHYGMVWCPSVRSGTWVARRNGTVYFTGNTMEARGWTSAIAGSRVDILVVDDIQSLRSLNQTGDMLETFRQDFLSRVGREGKIIVIGTRVGEKDVYQALIDNDLVDRLVMLPATEGEIVDCPLGNRCDLKHIPHEKPLCPEMWPVHDLARKRKHVGESAWWRNYQQKPRNAKDATFTEEMVTSARNTLETLQTAQRLTPGWRRFAALDPAIRGGNSLIGCEGNGQSLRVVGLSRNFDMVRSENILDDIDRGWKLWRYTDLIIEVNAYQKALGNDERLRNLSRLRGFRIHQHTTGVNKLDPDFGVASMASVFIDGQIEWPYGDEQTRATLAILEQELLAWRDGVPARKLRQDTVMSLWFAWLFWAKRRKGWLMDDSRVGPGIRRQGLPWQIQGYQAVQDLARAVR